MTACDWLPAAVAALLLCVGGARGELCHKVIDVSNQPCGIETNITKVYIGDGFSEELFKEIYNNDSYMDYLFDKAEQVLGQQVSRLRINPNCKEAYFYYTCYSQAGSFDDDDLNFEFCDGDGMDVVSICPSACYKMVKECIGSVAGEGICQSHQLFDNLAYREDSDCVGHVAGADPATGKFAYDDDFLDVNVDINYHDPNAKDGGGGGGKQSDNGGGGGDGSGSGEGGGDGGGITIFEVLLMLFVAICFTTIVMLLVFRYVRARRARQIEGLSGGGNRGGSGRLRSSGTHSGSARVSNSRHTSRRISRAASRAALPSTAAAAPSTPPAAGSPLASNVYASAAPQYAPGGGGYSTYEYAAPVNATTRYGVGGSGGASTTTYGQMAVTAYGSAGGGSSAGNGGYSQTPQQYTQSNYNTAAAAHQYAAVGSQYVQTNVNYSQL